MARVQIPEAKLYESSWFWSLAKDVLLQRYQIFLPLQKNTNIFKSQFDLNYHLFIYYLSIIIMVATSSYVSLLLRNDVRPDKKEIRVSTFKHVSNFLLILSGHQDRSIIILLGNWFKFKKIRYLHDIISWVFHVKKDVKQTCAVYGAGVFAAKKNNYSELNLNEEIKRQSRPYFLRRFTVPYFPVRSSRSSAMRYKLPSWMSVKTT